MRNAEQQAFHDEISDYFTLILLHIHSWNFKYQDQTHAFSFKTLDFDALQQLHNNELIRLGDKQADVVLLTPDGVAMAKDFMRSLTQLEI
jgi:hypothetical protein